MLNTTKPSKIVIGSQALKSLNKFLSTRPYKQYFIICDNNTIKHCLPIFISQCTVLKDASIFEIEAGEQSKVLEVAAQIWETLLENKAGKDCLIINLGGGVVSDLGAFCASVYKRGIDYLNVPTSLLAMVDASVGHKTAIDFYGLKNVIGSYHQALGVFIDPLFLLTLPMREMKNGLAEIVKVALIADKKWWLQLNNLQTHINASFITKAVSIKSKIVKKDPYDKGIRKTLNYGHSMAHAIEALYSDSKNKLLHGEAVIIGMMIENHISYQKNMLTKKELVQINEFLFRHFKPMPIQKQDFESILHLLGNDKKNNAKQLQFSLLEKIGQCKINVQVKESEIKKAIQYYIKLHP